jgi:SAM-dependent methyltransferase
MCKACGTLRFDPYLSAQDLSDFYVGFYQEMYARVTNPDTYFTLQQSYGKRLLRFAQKVLRPGARVVEVGCGAGGALAVFQDAGYRVLGCDYAQPLLEMGRQRGVNDLYFGGIEALVDKLTSADKADLIFLHHVIEHVSDPAEVLKTAQRMISGNGLVVVAVPDVTGIDRFPFPSGNLRLYLHIAHKFNFTAQGLAALGRRVGMHASVIPMQMSTQAPEMWVAFGHKPLEIADAPAPETADVDGLFRLLRRIERRFLRNAVLSRLGGPFRRFARPAAPTNGIAES